MSMHPARELWHRLELIHSVVYFSEESWVAMQSLGMRDFFMGFVAGRTAPMGPVRPSVAVAAFFNFREDRIAQAIPEAWQITTTEALVSARREGSASALRRLVPEIERVAADVTPLLAAAVSRGSPAGRPLFAVNRQLARPDDPVESLWQQATSLREHRGDGHVAVLTAHGFDGCEAHLLAGVRKSSDSEMFRRGRGWSEDEWHAARGRLEQRGLLQRSGELSEAGRATCRALEAQTDQLAGAAFHGHEDDLAMVIDRLTATRDGIIERGAMRFPNAIGLPLRLEDETYLVEDATSV